MQGKEKKEGPEGQIGSISSNMPDFTPYLTYDEDAPDQVSVLIKLPSGWVLEHDEGDVIAPTPDGFYTTTKNSYEIGIRNTGGGGGLKHFHISEDFTNIGFSEIIVKDKDTDEEKGKTIIHNGSFPKKRPSRKDRS